MQLPILNNPLALLGILLAIPIILLYLLKPKPKQVKFPTVMFMTKIEKDKRFKFFPKRFIRDPLLIIQILLLIFLVLAITEPQITTMGQKNPEGDIAIILDASASMQSTDVAANRFENAKELAEKIIDEASPQSTFTIILAEKIPVTAAKKTDKEQAKTILEQLTPTDSPANLGDAVIFAKDLLAGSEKNKEIYVISDYAKQQGIDLGLAGKLAANEGIQTTLLKSGRAGQNIAIVEAEAKRYITNRNRFYLTATIQNHAAENKQIQGEILLDNEKIHEYQATIPGKTAKLIQYDGPINMGSHIVEIRINTQDDLEIDNKAYISLPEIKTYNVLLITDGKTDTFLEYALSATTDIKVTKAIAPIIPEFDGYDTVIQGEQKKNLLLQGMYADLGEYLRDGGSAIILATTDLSEINDPQLKEILPVELEWVKYADAPIEKLQEHEIFKDTVIEDITAKRYYKATEKEQAETLAKVGGMPAISYMEYGKGKVIYNGVNPNPDWSNLYYSSSMPIFWYQMVKWANKKETAFDILNYRSGEYLQAAKILNITTPQGKKLESDKILIDETGIYEVRVGDETEKIAVSLLDEEESDIAAFQDIEAKELGSDLEKQEVEIQYDIYPYLLAISIILLIAELYYYVKRGYFEK